MPSQATSRPRILSAVRLENTSLLLGLLGLAVGAAVGVSGLPETRPLFGNDSIGNMAALAALVAAVVSGLITLTWVTPVNRPWFRSLRWWRLLLNVLGLTLLHAMLALLTTLAAFAVFQNAFEGLALDRWAGAFWVAAAGGLWGYITASSAMSLTTHSLSVLLLFLLGAGALSSASSASEPRWWDLHFSALGTSSDFSGLTFTMTLLVTGIALTTVGDFLAHDLGVWAVGAGERAWKVTAVRAAMLSFGVLVALVALIPVDVNKEWHDTAAQSLVLVFAVALVSFPIMFRRMTGSFQAVTLVIAALLVMLLVLYEGVDYLNTTAFEMGAGAAVFLWLLLFIRTVTAAVEELPHTTSEVARAPGAEAVEPVPSTDRAVTSES